MAFFNAIKNAVGGMAKAAPKTAPVAGGRKVLGGLMGARMAPQATSSPEAQAPQKPGDIWAKFRKR